MHLAIVAAVVGWFVAGIASLVYMIRLKQYRTDIKRGEAVTSGASNWAWELNVFSPDNYSAEGRAKLPVLYGLVVVQFVCALAAVLLLAG